MANSDWVYGVRRVDKPWGHEEHFALVIGKFCGKTLHVRAGHALSLQYHQHKEETVALQSGRVHFEVGLLGSTLEAFELLPGESVHLPPGTVHRLTALQDSVVLEASMTELDDVVRLEDRYGRLRPSAGYSVFAAIESAKNLPRRWRIPLDRHRLSSRAT